MDRRLTPFSGRVAARHLEGQVAAELFLDPEPHAVRGNPFLRITPAGKRDRQLLTGDAVETYERRDGWAYVRAAKDGFCGWIEEAALVAPLAPTHRIAVRTTWTYPEPSLRAERAADLHFGTRVRLLADEGRWCRVETGGAEGWVPAPHLAPLDSLVPDPVAAARLFLGTPYVWGGNTGFGLDCSGLVQASLLACGIACPGDSDLQEQAFPTIAADAVPQPGDLYFWKGHVAMLAEPGLLIHAYAHAMQVAHEPVETALPRILAAGDPVTSIRRPR